MSHYLLPTNAILRTLLLLVCALPLAAQRAPSIPAPEEVLGFKPGTDGRIASYKEIRGYFARLGEASPRVEVRTVGKTTEGRPFDIAIISSEKNIANLEKLRLDNAALTDPRKINKTRAAELIENGKGFVLINEYIHSSEVGPAQAGMVTAHFLATTQDEHWLKALDDVVTILTLCHNPDGYETVVDWWRKTKDDPATRGAPLPVLYHKYVGHDNNRDWFMLTQQETRVTVSELHMKWHPQIVVDQHQMGGRGARMFVPPYVDPYEPNVHPLIRENTKSVGMYVMHALTDSGRKGVWCREQFDAWTPARAFMHYHGAVRFLTEVASANWADPVDVKRPIRGKSATRSVTNPAPWKMGQWNLGQIVDYTSQGALQVVLHVSLLRKTWLTNFYLIHKDNTDAKAGPAGFFIPSGQQEDAVAKLIDIMQLGGVEYERTTLDAKGPRRRNGFLIRNGQPYFCFARALLENTPYPEIRVQSGGRLRTPYDVTSHNLPLLMNLKVEILDQQGDLPKASANVKTFVSSARPRKVNARIGLYSPWLANMDEGWTRFLFDHFKIPFARITNEDFKNNKLKEKADVIVFASYGRQGRGGSTTKSIVAGRTNKKLPAMYRGGIGDEGRQALLGFVIQGGTVVTLNASSQFAIDLFSIPLKQVKTGSRVNRGRDGLPIFNIPGAMLNCDVDMSSPLAAGCTKVTPVFFWNSRAFEPSGAQLPDSVTLPVRYAKKHLVAGGWAQGAETLAGHGAVAVAKIGKDHVVLFGFSPQFRCQTWGTFPMFFNALRLR